MKYRCAVVVYEYDSNRPERRRTLHFTIKTTSLRAAYEKAHKKAREVYDSRWYATHVEDISEVTK